MIHEISPQFYRCKFSKYRDTELYNISSRVNQFYTLSSSYYIQQGKSILLSFPPPTIYSRVNQFYTLSPSSYYIQQDKSILFILCLFFYCIQYGKSPATSGINLLFLYNLNLQPTLVCIFHKYIYIFQMFQQEVVLSVLYLSNSTDMKHIHMLFYYLFQVDKKFIIYNLEHVCDLLVFHL